MNKPFLKWAGSKRKIIDDLIKHLGHPTGRLIEPFVGSGTVFLNIMANGYVLGDLNADLINLYEILKKDSEDFIKYTEENFFKPETNNRITYNRFRAQFNKTSSPIEKAALFLYLNRHSFNGLCRYNSSGGFNVPFGKYNTIYFPKLQLMEFAAHAQDATFMCADFVVTMSKAKEGDLIYCDPPYAPLSATSNFTGYCAEGFHSDDQKTLALLAETSPARVVISNNYTEFTEKLYENASKIVEIEVQKSVGSSGESRKKTKEIIAIYNK